MDSKPTLNFRPILLWTSLLLVALATAPTAQAVAKVGAPPAGESGCVVPDQVPFAALICTLIGGLVCGYPGDGVGEGLSPVVVSITGRGAGVAGNILTGSPGTYGGYTGFGILC